MQIQYSQTEQKIADIVAPVMQDMGYDLLWVEYKGGILSIFAENPITGKLTLDDCTKISREISPHLEVEDPISGAYRLEVSSAGLDRPLFKAADFERFHDLEAKVELYSPLDQEGFEGQKKFRGYIRESNETGYVLETDKGRIELLYAETVKAKLVMTDELIEETRRRFEAANNNLRPEEREPKGNDNNNSSTNTET